MRLSRQLLRFGIIGVCATITHAVALFLGVEVLGLSPVPANGAAFSLAVLVTFFGQSLWVFENLSFSGRRVTRFCLVAFTGLAANIAIMALTVGTLNLHYWIGFSAVITVVPAVTFVVSKLWVFRSSSPDSLPS